jgi:hypothetical protein
MAAKFIRILAVLAALVVGETVFVGTASATLTSCGGAVGSPQQMVAKWKGMGVFADGSKLFRSGGFSKVDFPSIDKLVAQRAVMAPLASATVVPNTACGGGHMVPFGSRQRPRGYPMAVMLPNNLSKSDRCSHVGRGCKSERVWVFAFGQGLCSNGTHKRVLVVIIIKKVPTKHKPPAHKPPVVTPPPPQGNCNVVIIGNGNNVSACNVTIVIICSGVNVVIGGPDSNSVNQAVQQYEQSHNCNVKAPPPPPVVPPPATATVKLVKYAYIDSSKVATPSGFGFTANGVAFTNTGENTTVGTYQVGTSVTTCEVNAMGWTQDKTCETQIVASNGNTFVFTNSKKTPPPPPKAPTVSAQAQACVNQGESNGVVNGTVTNPNGTADIADISLDGHSTSVSVAANGLASFSLSGFAPGTYSGTATLRTAGTSASFSVPVAQCPPSPKVEKPSATASASCPSSGGNGSGSVIVSNGSDANANTTITVNINGSITTHTLAPGESQTLNFTVGTDTDVHIIVTSSNGNVLYENTFPHCVKPPAPKPSASASSSCPVGGGAGTISVVLSNSGNADAVFVVDVNGSASTITVPAGQTQTKTIALGTDTDVRVRVASGGVLLLDETFPKCAAPPPPPPHHTQITCTGFEEISGGGSFLVDCDVSSDNGAPISLSAHSNDSNTRVSGINCISNGGTPSCPGNGTYEFRVTGNNSGSTILYSSITAVASANGVPATFTSDPFPVDPSGGGF